MGRPYRGCPHSAQEWHVGKGGTMRCSECESGLAQAVRRSFVPLCIVAAGCLGFFSYAIGESHAERANGQAVILLAFVVACLTASVRSLHRGQP